MVNMNEVKTKEVKTMKRRMIKFASPAVLGAASVAAIMWVSAGQLDPPAGTVKSRWAGTWV